MIVVDSSVVVAAFASWHELHESARATLDRRPRLAAHGALESYSVLTRLPAPHRAPPELVLEFLAARFKKPYLTLDDREFRTFLATLRDSRIAGGASYDALIASVARAAGASLISCDRRASATYELLGVEVDLLQKTR